jgi:hypothetical protein
MTSTKFIGHSTLSILEELVIVKLQDLVASKSMLLYAALRGEGARHVYISGCCPHRIYKATWIPRSPIPGQDVYSIIVRP